MNSLVLSNRVTVSKRNESWILYNWKNGEFADVYDKTHPIYLCLESGDNKLRTLQNLNYEDFSWLCDKDFFVERKKEEYELANNLCYYTMNQELYLIILPAGEKCNFSCVYCYENNPKEANMGSKEKEAILNLVKNVSPENLHIEYFGGEPLINKNFIVELNQEVNNIFSSKSNNPVYSMTTNGYLLNINLFKKLYAQGLKNYQITLDGLEEDHNKTRILKNGKGSYFKIFQNLRRISSLNENYNFQITIRVNFSDEYKSQERKVAFITEMRRYFRNDRRFNFRFRPISDLASINNKKSGSAIYCSRLNASKIQKEFEDLANFHELNLADISMYDNKFAYTCYAGKPNSFIVSPDLSLKKCTVALDFPMNKVGYLSCEGYINKNENWDMWSQDCSDLPDTCSGCFFVYQCSGNACPLANMFNGNRVCPDVKLNYSHKVGIIIDQLNLLNKSE